MNRPNDDSNSYRPGLLVRVQFHMKSTSPKNCVVGLRRLISGASKGESAPPLDLHRLKNGGVRPVLCRWREPILPIGFFQALFVFTVLAISWFTAKASTTPSVSSPMNTLNVKSPLERLLPKNGNNGIPETIRVLARRVASPT